MQRTKIIKSKARILLVFLATVTGVLFSYSVLNSNKPVTSREKHTNDSSRTNEAVGYVLITNKFHWKMVESSDYRQYVSNLVAIGCPTKTLIDIVAADVSAHYRDLALRSISGLKLANEYPYWKKSQELLQVYSERDALLRQLRPFEQKRVATTYALLGHDHSDSSIERWSLEKELLPPIEDRILGFLSRGEKLIVEQAQSRLKERIRNRFKPGALDPSDMVDLVAFNREFEAELSSNLSTQAKLEFDLRKSETAQRLRKELQFFDASKEEFRNIFVLKKAFEDKYDPRLEPSSPIELAEKTRATMELNKSIRELLGEPRYDEYSMLTDYRFTTIGRYADANGLPKETSASLYKLRVNAEALATVNVSELSPSNFNERIQQLRQDTQSQLIQILGADQAEDYYKKSAKWINRLGETDEARGRGQTFIPSPQ